MRFIDKLKEALSDRKYGWEEPKKWEHVGDYEIMKFNENKYMVRYNDRLYGYISEPTEEAARIAVQTKLLYEVM